jgi:hypothetical protein
MRGGNRPGIYQAVMSVHITSPAALDLPARKCHLSHGTSKRCLHKCSSKHGRTHRLKDAACPRPLQPHFLDPRMGGFQPQQPAPHGWPLRVLQIRTYQHIIMTVCMALS